MIASCRYCGATDPLPIEISLEFPGSEHAWQYICGCGTHGPLGASTQDALKRWNQLMEKEY